MLKSEVMAAEKITSHNINTSDQINADLLSIRHFIQKKKKRTIVSHSDYI